MLSIRHLFAGYRDLPVLHDISLGIPLGDITVLMGPNGAGKSTLLKAIFNLSTITKGTIFLGDRNITQLPTEEYLRLGIAYVPQGRVNFLTLTVRENVLLGGYTLSSKELVERNYVHVLTHFPRLKKLESKRAMTLSGGEQQMLALARALMVDPKVLLLDEPSLGLSPRLVSETFSLIARLHTELAMTVLMVEHNLKSALAIADHACIMAQGAIVAKGEAHALAHSALMEKVYLGKME